MAKGQLRRKRKGHDVELATRALSSLGKAVAQSMQLRRARVTPAIWVSVHDPPEKGSLHTEYLVAHALDLCCQTNVFTSRKESLAMVGGFRKKRQRTAPSFPLFDRSTSIFPHQTTFTPISNRRQAKTQYQNEHA
jgi:hypothetical protein